MKMSLNNSMTRVFGNFPFTFQWRIGKWVSPSNVLINIVNIENIKNGLSIEA